MSKHLPNSSVRVHRCHHRDGDGGGGGGGDGDRRGEKNHVLKSKSQPMSISFVSFLFIPRSFIFYFSFYFILVFFFLFFFFSFFLVHKKTAQHRRSIYNSRGNITSTYTYTRPPAALSPTAAAPQSPSDFPVSIPFPFSRAPTTGNRAHHS